MINRRPKSKNREIENAIEDWLKIQRMDPVAVTSALAQVSAAAKSDFTTLALKHQEERFKSGDKRALLIALPLCLAVSGTSIPDWLREALLQACHSLPDCWDDVFGSPLPPNRHVDAARRDKLMQDLVYLRVREIKQVTKAFEVVGNECGMSKDAVRTMYYDYLKSRREKFIQHPFLREIVDLVKRHEMARLRDGQIAKELQELCDHLHRGRQRVRRRRRKSRPARH
jgi:hypothetical protein